MNAVSKANVDVSGDIIEGVGKAIRNVGMEK